MWGTYPRTPPEREGAAEGAARRLFGAAASPYGYKRRDEFPLPFREGGQGARSFPA